MTKITKATFIKYSFKSKTFLELFVSVQSHKKSKASKLKLIFIQTSHAFISMHHRSTPVVLSGYREHCQPCQHFVKIHLKATLILNFVLKHLSHVSKWSWILLIIHISQEANFGISQLLYNFHTNKDNNISNT